MKAPCVTCCGRTLMIAVDGESHLAGLDIHLDKTFQRHSTITTD